MPEACAASCFVTSCVTCCTIEAIRPSGRLLGWAEVSETTGCVEGDWLAVAPPTVWLCCLVFLLVLFTGGGLYKEGAIAVVVGRLDERLEGILQIKENTGQNPKSQKINY